MVRMEFDIIGPGRTLCSEAGCVKWGSFGFASAVAIKTRWWCLGALSAQGTAAGAAPMKPGDHGGRDPDDWILIAIMAVAVFLDGASIVGHFLIALGFLGAE